MSSKPQHNGTDHRDSSQRPDWYVPIAPVENDERTVQELLQDLQVVCEPGDLSDDLCAELAAYLDQFLLPRPSP